MISFFPIRTPSTNLLVLPVIAGLCLTLPAYSSERRFAYVYETTTHAKGDVEFEQWVTWKASKESDRDFQRFEFRHEIEIGLTDHLQLGVYVADWRVQSGQSVSDDGPEYRNSGIELIYNLTNPTSDIVGLALYGEYKGGPDRHVLEGKILLQKNIGNFVFAYNVVIESEWEKESNENQFDEVTGEFQQSAGVSYQVSPKLLVGAELLHEIKFPDWSTQKDDVLYFGPNVSYRSGNKWWITVTPLFQVTEVAGEPDFQTRMLIGIEF